MSNSYFQFKQFRIEQGNSAMKVCTDSCIFGSYIDVVQSKKILDIGTGTGLLALMMAQRSNAIIEAIEIEDNAFHQAKSNVQESNWKNRIVIHHTSIQEYQRTHSQKFDTIISNPPFYTNQLKSPLKNKNIAHHSELLTFNELAECVAKLLEPNGNFYLILPEFEFHQFETIAQSNNLYPDLILSIKDKSTSPVFRIIGKFSFGPKQLTRDSMLIKNPDNSYSERFQSLLKDFYLHL